MSKSLAIIKGVIRGDLAIERSEKRFISRTPGDVTEVAHN
jgi:hypothetical protein